jgi:acyl carrier protein
MKSFFVALVPMMVLGLLAGAAPAGDAPIPLNEIVIRVRAQVAGVLNKRPTDVAMGRALAAQGADELDIVEIIMALEEEFHVTIPDDAVEEHGGQWNTLNVQRLAQIIQRQKRDQRSTL